MRIFNLAILSFLLCLGLSCFGQSSVRLRKVMEEHLKPEGQKPVHSIQVYLSNPDTVFCEAVGFADGRQVKADKDNQFKIASITKTMTAVIILQMQEEGLLSIDDKIEKYLGDNIFVKVKELSYFDGKPHGQEITIRQLMQHSSGLADLFTDGMFRFYVNEFTHKQQKWNPEKLMNRFYHYRLNRKSHFVPGDGYYYSDVNFFLLGLIVQKISGQTLAQQIRIRIFEPLKMQNSYLEFYEEAKGNGKIAHSYFGKWEITKTLNTSYDWAGGGVISTTTDLAIYLHGLFGGKLFRNEATLRQMTTTLPHQLKSGKTGYYGLGISQYTFNGDTYYGHAGFWGSLIAYCPAKKITFCGSINQVTPSFNTTGFIETLLNIFNEGKP